MTLTFTVRDPLSINALYFQPKGQKRRILTSAGRDFKHRVIAAAALARAQSNWPADPFRVAKARLSYQLFDYRGDTDGPRKALKDALEEILYVNDRDVEDGPAPFPIRDGGGRRVIITVDLLEQRTDVDAERERLKHRDRLVVNAKRRAANARKKLAERKTA